MRVCVRVLWVGDGKIQVPGASQKSIDRTAALGWIIIAIIPSSAAAAGPRPTTTQKGARAPPPPMLCGAANAVQQEGDGPTLPLPAAAGPPACIASSSIDDDANPSSPPYTPRPKAPTPRGATGHHRPQSPSANRGNASAKNRAGIGGVGPEIHAPPPSGCARGPTKVRAAACPLPSPLILRPPPAGPLQSSPWPPHHRPHGRRPFEDTCFIVILRGSAGLWTLPGASTCCLNFGPAAPVLRCSSLVGRA